jgi:hypothetical protein
MMTILGCPSEASSNFQETSESGLDFIYIYY